jgi:hypothetical protein
MNTYACLASLILCLGACAAPQVSPQSEMQIAKREPVRIQVLLPAPSGPLQLGADDGGALSMFEVLARLSRLTGVTFSSDEQVSEQLKHSPVALTQSAQVPAGDVYAWVESLLVQNGFVLGVLQQGKTPLVGVYSNLSRMPNEPPMLSVDIEQLDECRKHPALMVTTVVTLPNTEVRALGNSLRQLSPDTSKSFAIPVGTTNSIVLGGSGRHVADMVAMLRDIDERAARGQAVDPQSLSVARP